MPGRGGCPASLCVPWFPPQHSVRQGQEACMTLRFTQVFVALALLAPPALARAAAIRLVSSDAKGATFEFTMPAHSVVAVNRLEGSFWRIQAPGLTGSVAEEGRPVL